MREFGYPPFKAKEKGIKKIFIAEGNTAKEGTETTGRGETTQEGAMDGEETDGATTRQKEPERGTQRSQPRLVISACNRLADKWRKMFEPVKT